MCADRSGDASGELILALDVGTSSVRTALFTTRGKRLSGSLTQAQYPLLTDAAGKAEIRPDRLLSATRHCINTTHEWLKSQSNTPTVSAVGTSCFWHSTIGTDARGKALTPVITWADGRSANHAAALRRSVDERTYHGATGAMLHSSFWPARMRWLYDRERSLFGNVEWWMSPGEWLLWRIAGVKTCAHGMAGATGLYNPATLRWHEPALELSHLSQEKLLPLGDQSLRPHAAARRRWPLFAQAQWLPAIGDGAAGNLGSGANTNDTIALNYGTSAALRIVRTGRPKSVPFGLFAYRLDERRYLLGGATSNAGIVRQWAVDTLRLPLEGLALDRWIAAQNPGAHGLDVLPFMNGERAPYWRDELTGVLSGLRVSTSALDLVAALTEASYHRLALIADAIKGARGRTAIVSGGLARSGPALKNLADVTGLQLRASKEPEASLRGAAIFALESCGISAPDPSLGARITPDVDRARTFSKLRRRHIAFERTIYD
jgi:gluconokinase